MIKISNGVPVLIKIVLAPIEFLGVFIKPFSLLIRLYANIQVGIPFLSNLGKSIYSSLKIKNYNDEN